MVDGKTYDSKAIVGAAHGFLPGQEPLIASDFSGGAATVGRLLSRLGFEVTQAMPGLTVGELIEQLSALRRYRSPDGRVALYQPLTLLWAFGRAHQGLARMADWPETEAVLGSFLERHSKRDVDKVFRCDEFSAMGIAGVLAGRMNNGVRCIRLTTPARPGNSPLEMASSAT